MVWKSFFYFSIMLASNIGVIVLGYGPPPISQNHISILAVATFIAFILFCKSVFGPQPVQRKCNHQKYYFRLVNDDIDDPF